MEKTEQKERTETTQVQPIQQVAGEEQIQTIEQVQQTQPVEQEETHKPPNSSTPPGCKFYLGYLHKRPKSVEIPEKCLECGYVVDCLSPTARIVEELPSNP
jgi:hypothetical protein